jgi:hypothetical protein
MSKPSDIKTDEFESSLFRVANKERGTTKSIMKETQMEPLVFDNTMHTNAFRNVYELLQEIYLLVEILIDRLAQWKSQYDLFTKKNAKKQYLYSLDIFFFQYKIFVFEMEHFTKYIAILNHRIYGDYYRLSCEMTKDIENHPKFDELDPFFEYSLEQIESIYTKTNSLVAKIYTSFHEKQQEFVEYKTKNAFGYFLFPFLNTLQYEKSILKEQISLNENLLFFFYESHQSLLTELLSKIKDFEVRLQRHYQLLMG